MGQVVGTGQNQAGVLGESETEDGVLGLGKAPGKAGVAGVNDNAGNGVLGRGFNGVFGDGKDGNGAVGVSQNNDGVLGTSKAPGKAGVAGVNDNAGNGVLGRGFNGVFGDGKDGNGVVGVSQNNDGVLGISKNAAKAGVAGVNESGGNAGFFNGNVVVTRDLILTGGDVAEQFDVAPSLGSVDEVGPGTVVVLDDEGALAPCTQAYDSCVAGVVSGAGDRAPALILDRNEEHGEDSGGTGRREIGVVGKVWCQSEASNRPIRVGDLLTTSAMPGHAMAAVDREAAFGAVLGKALTPLGSGTGLVLTLVGLA